MVRALPASLAVAGTLASAASAAAGPPAAVVDAFRQTAAAASASLTVTERIQVGPQTVTTRLRGIEQPRAKAGTFVFSVSPAQAGLGQASEILSGSKVYVHYPVLDTLHAKNPSVKSWVVVDSRSSLGVDPSGFTALGTKELDAMTGFEVVGSGADGGVRVTRWRATLDLRRAAGLPQLQQLLAHLPSASAAVLHGTERFVVAVGSDGYVHHVTATIDAPLQGVTLRVVVDAALAGFGQSNGPIIPPPASETMTLARFYQALGLPAPADTALLGKVVLRTAQVGAGYVLSQIPGGQLVQGERTLDFCGLDYPSESLRTARLQVAYTKKGAALKASNEVVTYRRGGAKQALDEVTHAAATCPNGPVKNPPTGVTHLVRHTRRVTDRKLLPGAVAVLDVETGVVNGKQVTNRLMAVYQVRGNVLSAVYGTGPSTGELERRILLAAERSAANLRRYVGSSAAPTS